MFSFDMKKKLPSLSIMEVHFDRGIEQKLPLTYWMNAHALASFKFSGKPVKGLTSVEWFESNGRGPFKIWRPFNFALFGWVIAVKDKFFFGHVLKRLICKENVYMPYLCLETER